MNSCTQRSGSVDGAGLADTDMVIYYTFSNTGTCDASSNVIAFASACELERSLDR